MFFKKILVLQLFRTPGPSLSFYNNNYPNYAGYGFPHPHAYYGFPGWSPSPILSASAPLSVSASMMLSPLWFGGQPPIPVATSTPLNPPYVCSTSSQSDSSIINVQKKASGDFSVSGQTGSEQSLTKGTWSTTAVGNTKMDLSNYWTSISMENQSNDKNGPPSSWATSTADPQMPIFTPIQKVPIAPKPQFVTPNPMFYSPPFGHRIQYPFPPNSTGYFPMSIYQQNEVQSIITKDIKAENSKDAKNGIYRNCLVCGDSNIACGKNKGLQICDTCKHFFKRVVESDADKKATFQCSQGPGNCLINKETRSSCQFCRFQTCLKAGMDRQKENSADAKNSSYRNCLVCGENNKKCGKYTGTGLQVCNSCRQFFLRIAESGSDKTAIFGCSQRSKNCIISKETRSSCQFCRFQACLKAGMDRRKIIELN